MKILFSRSSVAALLLCLSSTGLLANADNFADATDIPYSNWESPSISLLNMTSETGEPSHRPDLSPNAAGKTVWWKWTAPANGFCILDTALTRGTGFIHDSVLSVYTGTAVNALTRVATNDDQGTSPNYANSEAAGATFYVTQGVTYHIAVDSRRAEGITMEAHKVTLRLRHLLSRAESRIGVFGGYEDDAELINARYDLSKTALNTYTLKVFLNGKTYSFAGTFGLDAYATHAIARVVPKKLSPASSDHDFCGWMPER